MHVHVYESRVFICPEAKCVIEQSINENYCMHMLIAELRSIVAC